MKKDLWTPEKCRMPGCTRDARIGEVLCHPCSHGPLDTAEQARVARETITRLLAETLANVEAVREITVQHPGAAGLHKATRQTMQLDLDMASSALKRLQDAFAAPGG